MGKNYRLLQAWDLDDGFLARQTSGELLRIKGIAEQALLTTDPKLTVAVPNYPIYIPEDISHIVIVATNPWLRRDQQQSLVADVVANIRMQLQDGEANIQVTDQSSNSYDECTLVLHFFFTTDVARVQQAEKDALAQGASFCGVLVRFPDLIIGPCSSPSAPDLFEHWYKRLVSASIAPKYTAISLTNPTVDWLASSLELARELVRGCCLRRGLVQLCTWGSVNLITGEYRDRNLLPWIDWPAYAQLEPPVFCADSLCDPEVGIVTQLRRIQHHEALPACVTTMQSDVADIRVISQWANNSVCQGSSINDWDDASAAAMGEAIERYCINIVDQDRIIVGAWSDLTAQGICAISPEDFILFSDEQYEQPKFRFDKFDQSTVIPWINGVSLTTGCTVYVPISMVYVNYNLSGEVGGRPIAEYPRINPVPYAGVAAGFGDYDPIVNALEEIIERDATMVWWHSRPAIDPVSLNTEAINAVKAQFSHNGFNLKFFILPNEFQIPVIAASLTNDYYQTCNIGFSCRPNIEDAALKAVTEAATLFEGSLDLLDPDGRMYRAIRRKELSEKMALPWRADRLYLDTIDFDYRNVTDLMVQQHVNLDPRAPHYRAGHLSREESEFDGSLVEEFTSRTAASYLDRLQSSGYEAISVDVTTPDVRACGAQVVRVLVPGLVPNFAAGDITLGKGRIQGAYQTLGILPRMQTIEELNYFPLPHA